MMNQIYELEKKNLIKKLATLAVLTIIFTIILNSAMKDYGFLPSLAAGFFFGLFFYIPGRIKSITHSGWIAAIVMTVIYYAVFLWVISLLGNWASVFPILIPLADIGISIYKVVSAKKES